ncbi:uncharacterized protein LOC141866665 isoform X3 [Acropora palmata]|uniref:uncharacterized protein LOC141866665 isoform X3 n=1 Tax=Acropora palmata TaxID=6131 RepID=UPI003DA1AAD8
MTGFKCSRERVQRPQMSSWTATLRFLILVYIFEEAGSTRWPAGSYGLPRAKSGCPHADGFEWLIGRRYQDTENTASSNERSNELHFDAQVNRGGISRGFCMKTSKWSDDRRSSWPPGKYCIYKKGETCPLKLLPGEVKWDDENKNNQNKKTGTLPDGVYDADTIIKYCCSNSGDVNVPISLPTLKPFFLLAYGSPQCQQVKWAVTRNEWIRFDTEDRGNSDHERGAYPYGAGIKDHNITYCYYQDCRNKLTKESGTFRSPNYPRKYPNGQLCSWNIMVNSTQRIRLIFTDFDLQEDRGTDSVTVYDGVDETGKMLGVFFGGNLPSEEGIISSSNTLFVMFQSDKNGSFKGFSASYIAVRIEECGTSLTSERGIFHSPNFPRRYPNGQLCSWNIIVSSTQRIHLIFTHFDLEEDKDTDSVTVYDGINETGKMLGMFHGGKLPSDEGIVSSSNTLSVIFQTDKSVSGTGFKASYSAVRIVAGKSSSIVETSSWPQTSLLLRPEPTSSSMSVVKTADLGISSTEYRETTSPATVYHSPSNWLVTTPSSTAENDTVKPMLAPSTTTGKDKTSLNSWDTMLIKKSTSTAMRLESTDYKLSGQITSSYKTESQQTTAIPEILSPECGTSLLTWERGILHSPNFPRHYPNGQLCSWNIIVKSTQRIHLIFTHFDLQEDKDTDSVIVYDGIDETGKILGVFYGGKLPSEEGIVSSSNTLFVIFQTDKSGSGTGFRATYSAVRIVAGTSSSIVETSSWPQTSLLLRPEPTSSMSVVKTSDLGITSTEYRETTSPATVYHSPSNWLVTTPSSIAESDIVKPVLAPSNTTDKDKTSLYPLNTMPIEKSTFTNMRSESTDYNLSRRITTSHKTEPQQTRAIPEILSSGVETIMAPSTTTLATEEVTSPIVRVLSITQTSLTATRTSKSQPVVTATVSSSSLISRHFTSRNQKMKHPTSEMNPITSSLPETRLTFSTEGKVWTSTLLLSTSRDKAVESMKTREGVTLSYTKAETTPFYKKMMSSTETPMLKVTLASKAAISTSQAQGIVSLPKSMEADAGMISWYTNTKMTTFFTDMTSKFTDMSMLKSTLESKPEFSTTLAWEMKARSASRISNLDLATSHTKGEITSFDFEMTSSVAGKSMETSLTEREISATPSMKVSKTAQVLTSTVLHLSSDKSLSTLSSLSTLYSSMSSLSSSTSSPSTSLLSSSSSSTSSPPSLSSSLSSILSSALSLSSSPSWSSLFSPSSSSLLSNSSLLAPRLSTAVAKQSKSASTPPTSTSIQRISQLPYSSSSSSLMSSRSVLTQTFPGQRSEATKQSKAALGVISSVQQSREFKSSPSLSSSSSALSSFTSSSSSSSLPSTIHPSSKSSKSPSFTSSSSSPLSSATSSLASSSSSPTSSLASSSASSSSSSSSLSSSPTSSLASSSSSSSSPSTLYPLSSPLSPSTSSSVTSSFSLTSSTLSGSSLSSSLAPLLSSTSTSSLSSSSSSASSSSLQLTPVLSSSLSSSSSSFSRFSWSPLSSSTSLKSSPSFSSLSPSVSSSSMQLSSSWRSLPRSSLLSVEQGTMSSHKGTKKTTHLTKSTHLSMTPLKYSSNGEQAVRKTSTVETSRSRTEQPTSSDPEKTSPTTDKTATNSSPTRNVVAQKAERGGGGLNIILIVVPVVVLFLLIILIVAVLTCYQRRKAKYELEGKT